MYNWLVYLHVAGTLGFMMAHGASASAAFALRRERNIERVRALLELSANSYGLMYLSLLVLLVSGVVAGFVGQWWGWGWIWASLALLVAISMGMTVFGSNIYGKVRKAVGMPYFENWKPQPPIEPASAEAIDTLLAKGNPILLTVIGLGGLLVILWLMMFKPF